MSATQRIVEVVLPTVGIILLLLTVASLLFRFGEPYRETVQKIKAFGIELQISVLTLLVLVAVTFSLSGAFFLYVNFERQLAELRDLPGQLAAVQESHRVALALAKQINVLAFITLQSVKEKPGPLPVDLKCQLFLYGDANPRDLTVQRGVRAWQYSIWLEDLTANTRIQRLSCVDSKNGSVTWHVENFNPLTPEYALQVAQDR